LRQRHGFEHGFPLIHSLRASAQRSTSVLFSFVLSLLIVAGPFAIVDQKRFWRDLSYGKRFVAQADGKLTAFSGTGIGDSRVSRG
jgi:hypothetical protein